MKTLIVAFYKFVDLPDFQARREPLLELCLSHGITGTVLLASEGINSTIAGPVSGVEAVLTFLQTDPAIGSLTIKKSWHERSPFYRMKVRLKKEIVRLGRPDISPNDLVGEYVAPEEWNALISDPEVTVIDTRNSYEFELGTFKRAQDPATNHFQEFPDFVSHNLSDKKDQKIAMFCTGGIRCEKATAFLRQEGFENVHHLQGGILNYLEKVPAEESLWEGDCFVFDNRITVDHDLNRGTYIACRSCRHALDEDDVSSSHYVEGISCPYCYDQQTPQQLERAQERQKQIELSRAAGRIHMGASPDDMAQWRQEKRAQCAPVDSHSDET